MLSAKQERTMIDNDKLAIDQLPRIPPGSSSPEGDRAVKWTDRFPCALLEVPE